MNFAMRPILFATTNNAELSHLVIIRGQIRNLSIIADDVISKRACPESDIRNISETY